MPKMKYLKTCRSLASLDANELEVGSKLKQRAKLNMASLSFVLVCDSRTVFALYTPLFAVQPCLSMTHTHTHTRTQWLIASVCSGWCHAHMRYALRERGGQHKEKRIRRRKRGAKPRLLWVALLGCQNVALSLQTLHQMKEKAKKTRLRQAPPTRATPQADYKFMSGLAANLTRTCGCRPGQRMEHLLNTL